MLRASVSFARHALFDLLNHMIQSLTIHNSLRLNLCFVPEFRHCWGLKSSRRMIKKGGNEMRAISRPISLFGAMAVAAPSDWQGQNMAAFNPFPDGLKQLGAVLAIFDVSHCDFADYSISGQSLQIRRPEPPIFWLRPLHSLV